MIKIMVVASNGEAREFDVYKGLLRRYSSYFSFDCDSSEGLTCLKMMDVDPEVFAYFVQFINAKQFVYDINSHEEGREGHIYIPLIKLWLLAQRIRYKQLADAVVKETIQTFTKHNKTLADAVTIHFLYTSTKDMKEARPLRLLFVHLAARWANTSDIFRGHEAQICSPFMTDMVRRLAILRDNPKANKKIVSTDYAFIDLTVPSQDNEPIDLVSDEEDGVPKPSSKVNEMRKDDEVMFVSESRIFRE